MSSKQQQYTYTAVIKERIITSNSLEELAKELQVSTATILKLVNEKERSVLTNIVEVTRVKKPSQKKEYVKKPKKALISILTQQ